MKFKRLMQVVVGVAIAGAAAAMLSACTTVATPQGMCGWVQNDGSNGHNRDITTVVYENQNPHYDTNYQDVYYVPCGPRNYIVNDGKGDNASVGDIHTPYTAYTKEHTEVNVQVNAYWQLDQNKKALLDFAQLCEKYSCAKKNDTSSGDANFATAGWNGMLKENFSQAFQAAVRDVMPQFEDTIWVNQDQTQWKQMSNALSTAFMSEIRNTTGYDQDLFCGSGNSQWKNGGQSPKGSDDSFTCQPVRFTVTAINPVNADAQKSISTQSQSQLQKEANQARHDASVPLYGDQTDQTLSEEDLIAQCAASKTTCNFYFGTNGTTPTK